MRGWGWTWCDATPPRFLLRRGAPPASNHGSVDPRCWRLSLLVWMRTRQYTPRRYHLSLRSQTAATTARNLVNDGEYGDSTRHRLLQDSRDSHCTTGTQTVRMYTRAPCNLINHRSTSPSQKMKHQQSCFSNNDSGGPEHGTVASSIRYNPTCLWEGATLAVCSRLWELQCGGP